MSLTRKEFLSVASSAAAMILLGGCASVDETADWTKEEALDYTIKHPDGWKMHVSESQNAVDWTSDDGIIMVTGLTPFSESLKSDLVAQTIYSRAESESGTEVGEMKTSDNKNGLEIYRWTREDKFGSGDCLVVFDSHSYGLVITHAFTGKDESAVTKVLNTLAVKSEDGSELAVFES